MVYTKLQYMYQEMCTTANTDGGKSKPVNKTIKRLTLHSTFWWRSRDTCLFPAVWRDTCLLSTAWRSLGRMLALYVLFQRLATNVAAVTELALERAGCRCVSSDAAAGCFSARSSCDTTRTRVVSRRCASTGDFVANSLPQNVCRRSYRRISVW